MAGVLSLVRVNITNNNITEVWVTMSVSSLLLSAEGGKCAFYHNLAIWSALPGISRPVGKRCRVNVYGERSAEPRFAGNLESDLVSHFVIVVVVRNPSTMEFSLWHFYHLYSLEGKRENFALLHVFRNLIWDCVCTIQYNKHFLSNFLLSYGHGYTKSPKWNKKNKHGIKQDLEEDICDWKSEAGCWIADATIPPCSSFLIIWWHDFCNILCNTCWLPTVGRYLNTV